MANDNEQTTPVELQDGQLWIDLDPESPAPSRSKIIDLKNAIKDAVRAVHEDEGTEIPDLKDKLNMQRGDGFHGLVVESDLAESVIRSLPLIEEAYPKLTVTGSATPAEEVDAHASETAVEVDATAATDIEALVPDADHPVIEGPEDDLAAIAAASAATALERASAANASEAPDIAEPPATDVGETSPADEPAPEPDIPVEDAPTVDSGDDTHVHDEEISSDAPATEEPAIADDEENAKNMGAIKGGAAIASAAVGAVLYKKGKDQQKEGPQQDKESNKKGKVMKALGAVLAVAVPAVLIGKEVAQRVSGQSR